MDNGLVSGRGSDPQVIPAAGTVVWRKGEAKGSVELLIVHRPRYNDWTFPKGKVDPGECLPVTATRETREEGGVVVRLGVPMPDVTYRIGGGIKKVSWWLARVDKKPQPFKANKEVDKVRWLTVREARKRISYRHEGDLLDIAEDLIDSNVHKSRTLILVRHAEAEPRETWNDTDQRRPLTAAGHERARDLTALLQAYGARRIVASPATRCLETVGPLMASSGLGADHDAALSEGADQQAIKSAVAELLESKEPTVVCTHRPVLPSITESLGLSDVQLAPGEALIVHYRKGKVLATERW
jgi:8-oxo-(d)GTP phosphatase